jgi:hypothetical protein
VLRDTTSTQARVSPQELKFANDYYMALGGLFNDQVLRHLPPNYSSLVGGGPGGGWRRWGWRSRLRAVARYTPPGDRFLPAGS